MSRWFPGVHLAYMADTVEERRRRAVFGNEFLGHIDRALPETIVTAALTLAANINADHLIERYEMTNAERNEFRLRCLDIREDICTGRLRVLRSPRETG